tara:strand:+ start:881 stop:1120 length:240 start_codon:yes stop_codon:yes gene_type:complete
VQGPQLKVKLMRYVRMNQICLDLDEVETIEWKKIDEDETLGNTMYTLRVHMKSGKMFTRQVYETQFEELKEQYKELIGE